MAKNSLEPKNYASKKEWAKQFVHDLISDWKVLRSERTERELRWQDAYDIWSVGGQDVQNTRNYKGRANLNFPQLRKEVETMTRRLVKAMFPEDYLKADPTLIASTDLATLNTQVVKHYYDNVMHLQQKLTPWLKQNVLYGTSPIRQYWKKEVNDLIYKKRYFKPGPRGELIPDFKRVKEKITIYDAPVAKTCDMFQTWIYPLTATDPDEIQRVYYRTKITYQEMLRKQNELKIYIGVEELKSQGKARDFEFDQTQMRMQALGESGSLSSQGQEEGEFFDLLEVWGSAQIDGEWIPYVCEIINETVAVRIQQNPLWHQSIPFNFARFIVPPGNEFYGRGLPESSMSIQHQLNDTLNQGMDSATLSLNAITIINPAYAPNAESFEVEPNAIWWADPNAVKPFTFPDLSDSSIKNAQQLRSIITEMSDNSPQLPDPIAGKARSTGQAQLAINEWQTDLYAFVNQIIIEALQPFAKQTHSLLQMNIPDDQIIRIAGKYAGTWTNRVVTPNDIVGSFDFKWMGAIQVENQSVKTQQMLSFLKIYPMIPPEAQIKINWENLITKLLRDGFNIKDVQNIIESGDLNQSVAPVIENKVIDQGGDVQVVESDDDQAHISEHTYGKSQQKDIYIRSLYDQHILYHNNQIQKKAQEAQIMQQQQMLAMANASHGHMPESSPQGQNGPPQPGSQKNPVAGHQQGTRMQPMRVPNNPNGNQGQLSNSTNPSDLEKGVRP